MSSRVILLLLALWSSATATEIADATGRTVQVPDHVVWIVPAGPPAAVLPEALAPDLMIGWPSPVSGKARAILDPDAANRPAIPRITGHQDVTDDIKALNPDLIVDYGTISPRYAERVRSTQQRTGIPAILLDGALSKIPDTFRRLGVILHREARAEVLARFAEAMLALPVPANHPKVLYARGADGLMVAAPDTDVTAVFTRLGWHVVAPEGQGTFRIASIEAIRALDPDMLIFSDPTMTETLSQSGAWKSVRAVRDSHTLTTAELDAVLAAVHPVQP